MPLISPETTQSDGIRRTNPYIPLLAYIAGVFFLALAGYQTFLQFESLIQQEKLNDLNAIAAMKIGQIVSWRESQERRGAVFSHATLLPSEFEQWSREGAKAGSRQQKIAKLMDDWRQIYGYRAVALVDREGMVRLAKSEGAVLDAQDISLAQQAMDKRTAILSDIHNDSGTREISLDLAAPLIVHDGKRSRVVGAAILEINPADFLYPLIQAWPTHTSTAETLLVRQEGENLLFLNELRHRKDKALTLRVPVNTPNLPPGMFLRGKFDPLNSVDYRGVPVVASVAKIPGTSWLMVAKIDKAELFAPIFKLKQWSAAVGAFILAGCGVLFFVWLQGIQSRYRYLKAQRDAAIHSGLLLKHFEYLTKYANDIILVADENGEIIEANDRAESAYGYTRDELLGMQIWDLRPSTDDLRDFHEQVMLFRKSGSLTFETTNRRKDGSIFPVEVSARIIEMLGVKYLQGIIRDITERKADEHRIVRLNDLYAAISQTNAAIVRIKDQAALFQEICRIAVEYGHFSLAWIGLIDAAHGRIVPVASSGPGADYLDGLTISIDANRPDGQGPTGIALHQGQAAICNDFETDPRTLPWHDKARQYGLRSSGAWPLMLAGKSVGVLTLYAGEENYFDDDMVPLLSSISQDISFALDNLAIEESLRQSEEKFRTLVENLPQRIFVKDVNSVYVSCNALYARDKKMQPSEIVGKTDFDFYPQELAEKRREYDRRIMATGQVEEMQEEYLFESQERVIQVIKAPFKNQQGVVIGVLGVFWDITERKLAENELLRQKSFFRQVIDADPNLIFVKDAEGRILLANQATAAIYGMTPDEMLGENYLASLKRRDSQAEFYLKMDREVIRNRRPVSFVHSSPVAGDEHWFLTSKTPMELPDGTMNVLSIAVDITERKRAEDEVRKSAERIEDLYNNAPCGYHSLDENGVIVQINNTELQWLGYTREEVVGKMNIRDLHAPRSLQLVQQTFSQFKKQGYINDLAFEFIRRDGSILPVMVNGTAIYGQDGDFVMSRSTVFDDTARRRAEDAMRESEERFRAMADNAPIIIWMADAQAGQDYSGCGFFNQGWHDFTGLTLAQTQGLNWLELVHPDDRERCLKVYQDAFLLAEPVEHEFRLMRRDGAYRWMLDSGVPRFTEGGKFLGFIGTVIDITEQKNAEAMRSEVERAGRLNIAVEMASGLAHELSQPLAAANNYLTGCLLRMKDVDWDKEKLRMAVELTRKQTDRAGDIINHLKKLIRKQGEERLMTDINALARDTVDFLEHEVKQHGIRVFMALSPLPLVSVNKVEIEQVLINLLKNAIEAMHGVSGPELRIATAKHDDSGRIQITVSDNGRGIASAERATIFDPFHTSKNDGLGLGLAICRSLVENHGGRIWVDAQREFGAEFNFTLPFEANHE